MSNEDEYNTKSVSISSIAKVHPISNEEQKGYFEMDDVVKNEYESNEIKSDNHNDDSDSDDDAEGLDKEDGILGKVIISIRSGIYNFFKNLNHKKIIFFGLFITLYIAYFIYAMIKSYPLYFLNKNNTNINVLDEYIFSNNRGLALFVLTLIASLIAAWDILLRNNLTPHIKKFSNFLNDFLIKIHLRRFISWIIISAIVIGLLVYLLFELEDKYNFLSILGIFVFVFICVFVSTHPSKINWHTLCTGLLIQFCLGAILLRIEFGYKLFRFAGDVVLTFLNFTLAGCRIVFDKFEDHYLAFGAIPVVIFFGAMINLLYYLGAVQYALLKLAWLVNILMGTSPTESMNAVANIFLGQTEAPLLVKPFLDKMTKSEIFSVMTGGFATVAGSVLAAYISFGVSPNHLIVASLMAAPGSLAVSKTMYPETKKTKAHWDAIKNLPKGDSNNVFEAFATGAGNMIPVVGGIVSNLIAFIALFAFFDAVVLWFFSLLGIYGFGLTGVNLEDCKVVSGLIGTKMFVNEFVAYSSLGKMIAFKKTTMADGTYELFHNGSRPLPSNLPNGMIWNDRSVVISTYALCGFANFASIGIQIGTLSALAPRRTKEFASLAFKAMIAGSITSFITASMAGLLYKNQ